MIDGWQAVGPDESSRVERGRSRQPQESRMASRSSPFLAGMGAAPMPLQQALVGLLMQLQGGSVDVRLGDLTVGGRALIRDRRAIAHIDLTPFSHRHRSACIQAPLRTLAQALAPLSPRTVAACLPMVMLPVYSVLTSPDAAPGKDGARLKQRTPAEADALVVALECVQVSWRQVVECLPRVVESTM